MIINIYRAPILGVKTKDKCNLCRKKLIIYILKTILIRDRESFHQCVKY